MTAAAGGCCESRAGTPPEELTAGFVERDGMLLAPLTASGAAALAEEDNAKLDAGANRCVEALLSGEDPPPPARLTAARTFDGERLRLDVLWDPEIGKRVRQAARRGGSRPHAARRPVGHRGPGCVHRAARRRRRRPRHVHARSPARRARGGDGHDPQLARRFGRADRRGRGGARRRARAVSVGGRALRAARRAGRSSPTSRGSARPSRRSPRSRPTAPSPRSSSAPRR